MTSRSRPDTSKNSQLPDIDRNPSIDDVLAENSALRAENARLRDLLGLDERTGAEETSAWSPRLFAEGRSAEASSLSVDRSSSRAEKIRFFRSLFVGRDDVYAQRWENSSAGKAGWSPAVRGGWRNARRPDREYLPLTEEVTGHHLAGKVHVGVYPLLPGDACRLLVADFDGASWVLDALAYLDAARAAGMPAALERSRSGDGGHVWMFFTAPVPAASARRLGERRSSPSKVSRCTSPKRRSSRCCEHCETLAASTVASQ